MPDTWYDRVLPVADTLDNEAYDRQEPQVALLQGARENPLAVGPIHVGAAAFAVLTISLITVYLKWLAGVEIPAEVLVPTNVWVGTVIGFFYPN